MDATRANRIVAAVIAGRKRWGSAYGTGEFNLSEITEALVTLHESGEAIVEDHKEELVRVKRQLTASKAREAKIKKQVLEVGQDSAVAITGDPDDAEEITTLSGALRAIRAEQEMGRKANDRANQLADELQTYKARAGDD